MSSIWVLVADEARGRIFEAQTPISTLVEQQTLVHPESKLPERKLGDDAPGTKQYGSTGGHRISEVGKAREHHALLFAKEIALTLKRALYKNQFDNLVLIAAPGFLGILRREIDGNLAKHISFELNKDLSKLSANDIRGHLPKRLPTNDHT